MTSRFNGECNSISFVYTCKMRDEERERKNEIVPRWSFCLGNQVLSLKHVVSNLLVCQSRKKSKNRLSFAYLHPYGAWRDERADERCHIEVSPTHLFYSKTQKRRTNNESEKEVFFLLLLRLLFSLSPTRRLLLLFFHSINDPSSTDDENSSDDEYWCTLTVTTSCRAKKIVRARGNFVVSLSPPSSMCSTHQIKTQRTKLFEYCSPFSLSSFSPLHILYVIMTRVVERSFFFSLCLHLVGCVCQSISVRSSLPRAVLEWLEKMRERKKEKRQKRLRDTM